jgi:hypothetical protein
MHLCIAYRPMPPGEKPLAVNKYHITALRPELTTNNTRGMSNYRVNNTY